MEKINFLKTAYVRFKSYAEELLEKAESYRQYTDGDSVKVKGGVEITNEKLEVEVSNQPKKMEVGGKVDVDFPEVQKVHLDESPEVIVSNKVQVEGKVKADLVDKEIRLHKSDIKEMANQIGKLSKKVEYYEKLISDNPEKYVPVRLSDGNRFYNAIAGIGRAIKIDIFKDKDGKEAYGLVNESNEQVVVQANRLVPEKYDRVDVTHTDTASTYTFELANETVAVVVIEYTDSNKNKLLSAYRND